MAAPLTILLPLKSTHVPTSVWPSPLYRIDEVSPITSSRLLSPRPEAMDLVNGVRGSVVETSASDNVPSINGIDRGQPSCISHRIEWVHTSNRSVGGVPSTIQYTRPYINHSIAPYQSHPATSEWSMTPLRVSGTYPPPMTPTVRIPPSQFENLPPLKRASEHESRQHEQHLGWVPEGIVVPARKRIE